VSGISCACFVLARASGFPHRDGKLRYGPEVFETYYSARLFPGFFASIDLQHIAHPAYNRDRGPCGSFPATAFRMASGINEFGNRAPLRTYPVKEHNMK